MSASETPVIDAWSISLGVAPPGWRSSIFEAGAGEVAGRAALRLFGGKAADDVALIRIAPGGSLAGHEGESLGHTLLRHVGLTDDELLARLGGTSVRAASTFADRAVAEEAVSGALTAHSVEIRAFLSSGRQGFKIEQEFNRPIGRTMLRGQSSAEYVNTVRVFLTKADTDLGYNILTAYPIP